MKNKTKLKLTILPLCLLCLMYFVSFKPKATPQAPAPMMAMEPEVVVMPVKLQDVMMTKELPARITSRKTAQVRPQADGIIQKRLFEEGSFVEAGQALYQIDASMYEADYKNAHAQLRTAGLKKARYHTLLQTRAISKQEYDDVVTQFLQAQSEVDKANIRLDYTQIYAPISGYIGKSNVTEGALVNANQADILATITQLEPIFADIALPTKELATVKQQGHIAASIIVNGAELKEQGIVKFSEVFADESTDTVHLRVKFANEDKKLLPGMFVNVKLHFKPVSVITVPQRVTSRGPDGSLTLWVVSSDNIATVRAIEVSQAVDGNWIVTNGLQEGEMIIYEGFQKIAPASKVKTVPLN